MSAATPEKITTVSMTGSSSSSISATTICDFSDRKKYPVSISCYVAMIIWVGWFILLPAILVLLYFLYILEYKLAFGAILGLMILSILYPVSDSYRPAWGKAMGSWMMQKACIYFGLRLVQEESERLSKIGPIIIAIEPHDVLPVCIFAFSEILGYFPGQKGRGCLASACFYVPFMKHTWAWANAQSVDKKNMKRLMKDNYSPGICPGGASEVTYLDDPNEYVLNLTPRKGMFRMAMETGHAVVPVFAFGQRKAYKWWIPSFQKKRIASALGFIPMCFFGAFNIPLFIPKSVPITVVTGSPVKIPQYGPAPDAKLNPEEYQKYEALVDSYHAEWIKGVERIFETYKGTYGCENGKLKII